MTHGSETLAINAKAGFPGVEQPVIDTSPWSARHLPEPEAPRRLRFASVALAAGLVAIVLATALSGPIWTGGTRAEPSRHGLTASGSAGPRTQENATGGTALVVAGGN